MTFWRNVKKLFQSDDPPAAEPQDVPGPSGPQTSPNPVYQPPPKPQLPVDMRTANSDRWRQGMPAVLDHYWEGMITNVDTLDYNQMRLDLVEEYKNPADMTLALFSWYGHGVASWDKPPAYETVAEQLLWELPLSVLIQALEDHPLDSTHLEGAARLFSGDVFVGTRGPDLAQIPPGIRQGMIEYLEEIKESDKIQRLKQALGAANG